MPDDMVISIENLTHAFDGLRVLDGVNLQIRRGETMVVMGGSGCGKTTLLRHLIGSIRPDSGRVVLLGQDLGDLDEAGLNKLRLRCGVVFQSGALFNSLTVGENVALPLLENTRLDPATIAIMVKIKLEMVDLREAADKMPAQISGGMKKRAGLARALALDPEILFYDEPSASLDPVTAAEIDQLILDLARGLKVTSVVVTHDMHSAFHIADRMAMLDRGRIVALGTKEEIRNTADPLVHQFVNGLAVGPITERKKGSNYEEDLLGLPIAPEQMRVHGV